MRLDKKNKLLAIALLSWLLFPSTTQAFVWPMADLSSVGGEINTVSTGLSKIKTNNAQISGYIATVQSIGDQVSLTVKYANDLQQAITVIEDSVEQLNGTVDKAKESIEETAEVVSEEMNKVSEEKAQTADNTTKEVETDTDSKSEEEQLETVEQAKQESIERDKEIEEMLATASSQISAALDATTQSLEIVENLIQSEVSELDEDTKAELLQESSQIKADIEALRESASQLFASISEKYSEESSKIIEAYDEYSKAISDYYAGKISKEDLEKAGDILKSTVASSDCGIDREQIDNLIKGAEDIAAKTQAFQEEVLNKISNNKEYSDEDEDKTSSMEKKIINDGETIKYTYNYHMTITHNYLKSEYGKDKSFLISKELDCDKLDMSKMETDNNQVQKLRDCLTRAKTEKEYFAIKGLDGCTYKAIDECNPFKNSLYKKYQSKGVYGHILEDYNAANVINAAKQKQWSHTWQDADNNNSIISTLQAEIEKGPDNTGDTYEMLAFIELQAPQIWSRIRKTDALHRAKKAISFYKGADTLYLDGRYDDRAYGDVIKAIADNPGRIDDGVGGKQDVFPNVMLHNCGIKAADVSVASDSANIDADVQQAEKQIIKCMHKYAQAVDTGIVGNEETQNATAYDEIKKLWREKEISSSTDSIFKNFMLATINLYKSSQDYVKKTDDGSDNIISLKKRLEDKNDALTGYAAGCKINHYTTNQILSMVESDAVHLQSEIIKNLNELSYNFFDKDEGEK